MKHTTCGGWIEIRTDPKNTAYVVTEGAKKRDHGEDKADEGDLQLRTEEERDKLRNDAFAALEVTIDDRKQATADKSRVSELITATERDWDDPYTANQKLRREFRVGRKKREKDHAATEALKDRLSLGIDLLEETEEDRRRAGFVDFGGPEQVSEERVIRDVQAKQLFHTKKQSSSSNSSRSRAPKLKAELENERSKARLRKELGQNTRTALDPFLSSTKPDVIQPHLALKRKREPHGGNNLDTDQETASSTLFTSLVDYESD